MWDGLRKVPVVFRFESRRSLMAPRLAAAACLAIFPAAVVRLVQAQAGYLDVGFRGPAVLYALLPGVTTLMCLLLWAVPAVHSEVEGRTWCYVAVRPGGKLAILLGKYLVAVAWTVAVGWTSLLLCMLAVPMADRLRTFSVLGLLIPLAALSYGALFLVVGVIFLRRAVVVAVGYTFLMEFLTAFIPAVIHRFTIQYHLRSLLAKWMSWTPADLGTNVVQPWLFSQAPAWQHLLAILGATAALLVVAAVIVHQRELVKPEPA